MRVIAGSAHGMRLRVPRGERVRPTSGRVREALFNILGPAVDGARVLDLFAGCGALGIEALSRGAARCWFAETARPALAALADNLARSGLADRAEILRCDALAAVPLLDPERPVDLALIDPPYAMLERRLGRFLALLEGLAASPGVARTALIVLQHDARTELPEAVGPLEVTDVRTYRHTALTFLERTGGGGEE